MLTVRAKGGTNAGRRKVRHEPRPAWTCRCGHENRGYHARCMVAGCNLKRPAGGQS